MKVEASARAVAGDRKTKSLIISAPRVSAPKKYTFGSAHDKDQEGETRILVGHSTSQT